MRSFKPDLSSRVGLVRPLQVWIEKTVVRLSAVDDGHDEDFARPLGEPALVPHDSVSWQVFKNPVSILIGGIAAVALELAEPRVRAGVYEHSNFRRNPLARLRRTGRATMVTVYGPESRARTMIVGINRLHQPVSGQTASGEHYRAMDPALLTWVHATASYGFLKARDVYVSPIGAADRDCFYRKGLGSAALYGAIGAPSSEAAVVALFDEQRDRLESSPLLFEFLETMCELPILPFALAPLQGMLVKAAVDLLPDWVRSRVGLDTSRWRSAAWQAALVRRLARRLDRLPLVSGPPVQACRRLGLPDDYLYRP